MWKDKIYMTKGFLTRHIKDTPDRINDIDDNISRILHYIPTPISSTHKWRECLPWMHNLHLTLPPFRQNIWLKMNKSTKSRIKAVYHNILQIVVASPLCTSHRPIIPFLHRSDVLWKIAFMFESLMLFQFPKNSKDTTATVINKRIHLFRTGNIKQLYTDSRNVISKTPLEKSNRAANQTISTRNKSAQLAADNDNYRSAIDRIVSDTPIAINTPEVVNILKQLYPKKHTLHEEHKDTQPKKSQQDTNLLISKHSRKYYPLYHKGKQQDHLGM